MFSGIISDESDHWNLMTQNPIIPEETQADFVEDEEEIEESHMTEDNDFVTLTQNNDTVGDEVLEISPSMGNAMRRAQVVLDKGKKKRQK